MGNGVPDRVVMFALLGLSRWVLERLVQQARDVSQWVNRFSVGFDHAKPDRLDGNSEVDNVLIVSCNP